MTGANLTPLLADFYGRPVLRVARGLLGCVLVRRDRGELLMGRIVETEAYGGALDPAAHSHRGPTARCATMFGPAGHCYVYVSYGMHHCTNVTAGGRASPHAVLLRAVEPIAGLDALRRRRAHACTSAARAAKLRAGAADRELCNGPGKLTASFGLDLAFDGQSLTVGNAVWIAAGKRVRRVHWTPRVGLGENPAAPWLWRCVDAESDGVTAVPSSWPRAVRPSPSLTELRRNR